MTNAAVTNATVAEAIGLGHSGVSRIRSGDRTPSLETMARIRDAYPEFTIEKQVDAQLNGKYAVEFERVLAEKHGAILNDIPVPSGS